MDERGVFVALDRDGVFAGVCAAEAWEEDEGTILDVGRVFEAGGESLSSVALVVFDADEALAGDMAGDPVCSVRSRVRARAGLAINDTSSLFAAGDLFVSFDGVTSLLDAFAGVSGIVVEC